MWETAVMVLELANWLVFKLTSWLQNCYCPKTKLQINNPPSTFNVICTMMPSFMLRFHDTAKTTGSIKKNWAN